MGEPLTEIIAMFERVFAEQPPKGEFVWAKQRR